MGDFVTQKAFESCKWVFEHDLHWNRPVAYTPVQCPKGLTTLTGLVPSGTAANLTDVRVQTITTTMEDCCEATCSRVPNVKGEWEPGFDAIYTCNVRGETYLEASNPTTNPCGGPTPCPGPLPTPIPPAPLPTPSPPVPTPGPTPSDCPGGSLDACIDLCPMDRFRECI